MTGDPADGSGAPARTLCGKSAARDAFLDRAFGAPSGISCEFPQLTCRDNEGRCWIVEEEGAIVAHAARTPSLLRCGPREIPAAGIGLVSTDPDRRGRGLATRVVACCLEQAACDGVLREHPVGVERDAIRLERLLEIPEPHL
jgi:GNAT superfamily N-acetyltransferase